MSSKMDEKSPYDILSIFSLKCSIKEPSFCLKCESCKLIDKINCTKSWFTSLGYMSQRLFLEELIALAPEMSNKLPTLLYGLHSKDYQYAKSRLKPSVADDAFQSNTNHSLDINKIDELIDNSLSWFKTSSEWSRSNYVLVLLQLCGTPVLDAINEFVLKHNNDFSDLSIVNIPQIKECAIDDFDSLRTIKHVSKARISKCKSAPSTRRDNGSDTHRLRKNIKSARERVLFDDKVSVIETVAGDGKTEPSEYRTNSRLPSRSSIRSSSSRYQFSVKSNSSARCTPLIFDETLSNVNVCDDLSTCNELNSNKNVNYAKDFIKCLPVHLAKKILGYLDERSIKVVGCVSTLWYKLAKEVRADEKYIQARKEDIMMMQSTEVKTPHPCYARRVPVFIPKLDANGLVQTNKEGKHVDVEIIFDEFADINMEHCYDGLETERVMMEERNVYCSSYNVLMVESRHEPNRHICYDGGDLITVGSADRKIHLVDVNTGDRVKRIYGHSGSIKCLYLNEKKNIAVSGSYDTTVRLWNLKSGKCNVIFLGHQGTVVCVDVSKSFLVSSATDCIMKIWSLSTGKCIMAITHSCVIKVLQILGDKIVTGSSNGEVLTWDIRTGENVKTFKGHENAVTCLKANSHFIFSGSSDCLVKLWNNIGNHYTCLKSYRHPDEVLCLDVCFCRLITGCFDGKVRIWNVLNANCLRVIRGNSKNDPISYVFTSENRLVVNTVSSILIYNFEQVQWDYAAPRDHGEVSSKSYTSYSFDDSHPYPYTRAQKMIYRGSPLHKVKMSCLTSDAIDDEKNIVEINNAINKRNRVKSAPVYRRPNSNNSQVFDYVNKMDRLQSAPNVSRGQSSVNQHITRIKSAHRTPTILRGEKDNILAKFEPTDQRLKSTTIRARCRSAPVQRVMDLSKDERGVSTSSITFNATNDRKTIMRKPPTKYLNRPKTAICPNTSTLENFKLRTFYSQLDFEGELQNI